jgi:hypothetical protein
VKVTAKGTVRVSVAGLCCYKPGQRSRLIYRTLLYRGRKGEPKGFRELDFIRLLDAAHQQLQPGQTFVGITAQPGIHALPRHPDLLGHLCDRITGQDRQHGLISLFHDRHSHQCQSRLLDARAAATTRDQEAER